MRLAGWDIKDAVAHLFGQGWPKSTREFKPSWELWAYGTKGSPALDIDAGRVKRGSSDWPEDGRAGGVSQKPDAAKIGGAPPGNGVRCPPLGSWPTSATLSHCETCERIGERRVKWEKSRVIKNNGTAMFGNGATMELRINGTEDGSETIPAFRCACYCDCGATWTAPSGGAPPRCQCGRAMRWACPVARLGEMSGESTSSANDRHTNGTQGYGQAARGQSFTTTGHADSGDASRYFNTFEPFCYFAKANGRVDKATGIPGGERHAGCEELYWRANKENPFGFDQVTREEWEGLTGSAHSMQYGQDNRKEPKGERARGNGHATVKSIKLMMHLISLSGATKIGDLCVGSGSTAIAVLLLNRRRAALGQPLIEFIGAEICPEAVTIANARLKWWGNISDAALEAFIDDDEMPANVSVHPGQSAFSW
jgi:hypothetical protein